MKLARDTIYNSATKTTMRDLIIQMVRRPIVFEGIDSKTANVRISGLEQLPGCKIWTEDFNNWKVHSITIRRLRRQRDLVESERS